MSPQPVVQPPVTPAPPRMLGILHDFLQPLFLDLAKYSALCILFATWFRLPASFLLFLFCISFLLSWFAWFLLSEWCLCYALRERGCPVPCGSPLNGSTYKRPPTLRHICLFVWADQLGRETRLVPGGVFVPVLFITIRHQQTVRFCV